MTCCYVQLSMTDCLPQMNYMHVHGNPDDLHAYMHVHANPEGLHSTCPILYIPLQKTKMDVQCPYHSRGPTQSGKAHLSTSFWRTDDRTNEIITRYEDRS